MPGGGVAEARLADGGNCFNLNSVAEGDPRATLTRRNSGVQQFAGLMMALDVPEADARRIAEAAADWVDSDSEPGPIGAEDAAYAGGPDPYRTANTLFADPGEARLLAGMTPEIFARVRPWLCVLPDARSVAAQRQHADARAGAAAGDAGARARSIRGARRG